MLFADLMLLDDSLLGAGNRDVLRNRHRLATCAFSVGKVDDDNIV